jgi:hypothetical protein
MVLALLKQFKKREGLFCVPPVAQRGQNNLEFGYAANVN